MKKMTTIPKRQSKKIKQNKEKKIPKKGGGEIKQQPSSMKVVIFGVVV